MKRIQTITRTFHVEGVPENLSERLLWVRHDNNITQAEMAENLGITRTSVTNKELGKQAWVLGDLDVYRDLFNLNMNWLFYGDGSPYRKSK